MLNKLDLFLFTINNLVLRNCVQLRGRSLRTWESGVWRDRAVVSGASFSASKYLILQALCYFCPLSTNFGFCKMSCIAFLFYSSYLPSAPILLVPAKVWLWGPCKYSVWLMGEAPWLGRDGSRRARENDTSPQQSCGVVASRALPLHPASLFFSQAPLSTCFICNSL